MPTRRFGLISFVLNFRKWVLTLQEEQNNEIEWLKETEFTACTDFRGDFVPGLQATVHSKASSDWVGCKMKLGL